MLLKSASMLALAACLGFSSHALAADAAVATASDTSNLDEVVVVGAGQTRSVSTMTQQNLAVLPPGTSVQKSLNFLPGVMAQSIDAFGLNEQSMSLQVRGFSTTHLGYTLDGMPLGDGAYNNYNGLTISRALISENLGRADVATGIAGLSVASTSNLGGALIYTSSDPKKDFGVTATETVGSESATRTFLRLDTGEHNGFSAYVSGQYARQNLFVNQPQYNTSTESQFNGKAQYRFDRGVITGFLDVSRTNQADDPYLSKDMISRLGWNWGGYAPNWQDYVKRAYCSVTAPTAAAQCVNPASPEKASDDTFTNGQILRNDNLYYLAGDYDVTQDVHVHLQGYRHTDKGDGNNFIVGWSNLGQANQLPVQIRDTRYSIDRYGFVSGVTWDVGFNHIAAGLWMEHNTSSAARYIWSNVTGPSDIGQFLPGTPQSAQWVQQTTWNTRQFYLQDTAKFFDDKLAFDFGFKSTYSKSAAQALPGIAATAPPASTQFATGTLVAKDNFLPEAGARWTVAPGHELYFSYAENMAMYQGGFKLGPQSVTQAIWNQQGSTLKPETSRTFDVGYRYFSGPLQASFAGYHVNFDNRLLQYNPCPTNQQQNPGCGNSFHNAGSVTSNGLEASAQWKPTHWLTWYNSLSYDKTTYDDNMIWCSSTGTNCLPKATAGKQQVDTPRWLGSSVVTVRQDGFWGSLSAKYTGRRYYTYTNDQSFAGYTTLDLGVGYDFDRFGPLKGAKIALNITNLTDKRYVANFDNSVFAPDDSAGAILVAHASAPRQVFVTFGVDF